MAKRQAFWISDSGGVETLHLNGTGLSKDESYLGQVARRGDEWFFVQKDVEKPHGPYGTYAQAKREGMRITGTEYVG